MQRGGGYKNMCSTAVRTSEPALQMNEVRKKCHFFFVEREINPWGLKSAVIDDSRKGEQKFTYSALRAYFCFQFMGGFLAGTCAGSNVKKTTYKKKHPCKKRTLNLFEMIRRKCSISALRFH